MKKKRDERSAAGSGAIYTGRQPRIEHGADKGVLYVRREEKRLVRTERLICVRSLYFVPTRL